MTWPDKYVGLPFRDGGRGPDWVDCWGLVCLVYAKELGLSLPPYGEISAAETLRLCRAIDAGKNGTDWTQVRRPRPFDVAVMRLPTGTRPGHVGIVADARHILHVERASSTALEEMNGVMVRDRIVGFWRYRDA